MGRSHARFLRRRGGRRFIAIGDLMRGGFNPFRPGPVDGTHGDVERAVYDKYHIPKGTVLDTTSGAEPLDPATLDMIIEKTESGRIPGWSVPLRYMRQAAVRKWNKGHPWMKPWELGPQSSEANDRMDIDLARNWAPMRAWASLGFFRPSEVQQFGGAHLRGGISAEEAADGARTGFRMVANAAKDVPYVGTALQAGSQFLDWITDLANEEGNKAAREQWEKDTRKQAGDGAVGKVITDWAASWGATSRDMTALAASLRPQGPAEGLPDDKLADIEAELPGNQALAWQLPPTVLNQLAVRYWNENHPWEAPMPFPPPPEQMARALAAYPFNVARTRPSDEELEAVRQEAMANWHASGRRRSRRFYRHMRRRMHGAGIFDVALSLGKKALPQIINLAAEHSDKLIKPVLERVGIRGDVADTIASHGQRLAKSGASKIDYSRFW